MKDYSAQGAARGLPSKREDVTARKKNDGVGFAVTRVRQLINDAERVRDCVQTGPSNKFTAAEKADEETALKLIWTQLKELEKKINEYHSAQPSQNKSPMHQLDHARREALSMARECLPHVVHPFSAALMGDVEQFCQVTAGESCPPRASKVDWKKVPRNSQANSQRPLLAHIDGPNDPGSRDQSSAKFGPPPPLRTAQELVSLSKATGWWDAADSVVHHQSGIPRLATTTTTTTPDSHARGGQLASPSLSHGRSSKSGIPDALAINTRHLSPPRPSSSDFTVSRCDDASICNMDSGGGVSTNNTPTSLRPKSAATVPFVSGAYAGVPVRDRRLSCSADTVEEADEVSSGSPVRCMDTSRSSFTHIVAGQRTSMRGLQNYTDEDCDTEEPAGAEGAEYEGTEDEGSYDDGDEVDEADQGSSSGEGGGGGRGLSRFRGFRGAGAGEEYEGSEEAEEALLEQSPALGGGRERERSVGGGRGTPQLKGGSSRPSPLLPSSHSLPAPLSLPPASHPHHTASLIPGPPTTAAAVPTMSNSLAPSHTHTHSQSQIPTHPPRHHHLRPSHDSPDPSQLIYSAGSLESAVGQTTHRSEVTSTSSQPRQLMFSDNLASSEQQQQQQQSMCSERAERAGRHHTALEKQMTSSERQRACMEREKEERRESRAGYGAMAAAMVMEQRGRQRGVALTGPMREAARQQHPAGGGYNGSSVCSLDEEEEPAGTSGQTRREEPQQPGRSYPRAIFRVLRRVAGIALVSAVMACVAALMNTGLDELEVKEGAPPAPTQTSAEPAQVVRAARPPAPKRIPNVLEVGRG
ncbi:MAG: hypothetical protein WDW36_003951 [Sanguina aurantia]